MKKKTKTGFKVLRPALNMDQELLNLFKLQEILADVDLRLAAIRRRCIDELMFGTGEVPTASQLIARLAKDLANKEKGAE